MRPNKGPPILLQTDEDFFYESLGQKKEKKAGKRCLSSKCDIWHVLGIRKWEKNTSEEMNLRRVLRICVRY